MAKGKWEVKGTVNCHADPVFFHTDIVCGGIRVARATGVGFDASIATAKLIAEAPETLRQRDALLAACKCLLADVEGLLDDSNFDEVPDYITKSIAEGRAAIVLTK